MFAHRESGLLQLGRVRPVGDFSRQQLGCPLWAQARQEGGGALDLFFAMFSVYTNPEPKLLLGVLPLLGSPFSSCLGTA